METKSWLGVLRRQGGRRGRGQNVIEFALIAPILIMLAFGIIDVGRMFYSWISLENSAREAARYLASHPTDNASTRATAVAIANGEAAGAGVDLHPPSIPPFDTSSPIEVTVTGDFSFITGDVLGIDDTLLVVGSASMSPLGEP